MKLINPTLPNIQLNLQPQWLIRYWYEPFLKYLYILSWVRIVFLNKFHSPDIFTFLILIYIFSCQWFRAPHILQVVTLSSSLFTSRVFETAHLFWLLKVYRQQAFMDLESFSFHNFCVVLVPQKIMQYEGRCKTYHICVRHWTKTGHIDVSLHFRYSICEDKELNCCVWKKHNLYQSHRGGKIIRKTDWGSSYL